MSVTIRSLASFLRETWLAPLARWLNIAYAFAAFVTFVRDNFLTIQQQHNLRFLSFLPMWHLQTWVALFLGLNLCLFLVGAYHAVRRRDAETSNLHARIDELEGGLKAPDLAVSYDDVFGHITITNVGSGTAHNIIISKIDNDRLYAEEEQIGFIQEGSHRSYMPRVYFRTSKELGQFSFGDLLSAGYNARPPKLASTEATLIPMSIVYSDAHNQRFRSDFQLTYIRSASIVNISLVARRLIPLGIKLST